LAADGTDLGNTGWHRGACFGKACPTRRPSSARGLGFLHALLYNVIYILGKFVMEDVVRSLGFLCLGSRLKRIGEQLQAETQRMLDCLEVPVQSSQYPLLATLERLGPLAVGELAQCLGVTQPGVTRSVFDLADLGLVTTAQSSHDQRRKIVSLTKRGQRLVDIAKQDVWPRIEYAVADLCRDLHGPLLDQLAAIEDGLIATPLDRRVEKSRKAAAR
jgi:DNA-binding MarR family transcriptional regulator